MIHLIMIAMFTNLIVGNSTWNTTNSMSGLLGNINKGLQVDSNGTIPNPLGSAIVIMVFIIAAAVTSFKTDLPLAAAFGAMLATGTSLLLQTPGLALVGVNLPYIFGGLTIFFIFIAMLAGAKSPFK